MHVFHVNEYLPCPIFQMLHFEMSEKINVGSEKVKVFIWPSAVWMKLLSI